MRHILRALEIAYVFMLYLVLLPISYRVRPRAQRKSFGERLHDALERLGIVFIKLGQFLATRNLFSEDAQEWLCKLWDGRKPLPFTVLRPIIENEIGDTIENTFDSFDEEALAAASVAQVHTAMYRGRKAAVKVVRPGAIRKMRVDIGLARFGVRVGRHFSKFIHYLDMSDAVGTVDGWLSGEVDLRSEAKGAERNWECYKDVDAIVIPEMWFVSETVLVMEFLEGGIPCSQWKEEYRALGYNPQASIRNWFIYSFGWTFQLMVVPIHGDPHPANILILPHGRVGLIDFGVWGEVTPHELHIFVDAVFAVYARNTERVIEAILELGGGELDDMALESFERDAARYVKKCRTKPFDWWLIELGNIVVRYQLPMPKVFGIICRFGILSNRIAQDFFPGQSTLDLVGDEIRAGMRKQMTEQFRQLWEDREELVYPIAYELSLQIRHAPQRFAAFIRDPLATIRQILDSLDISSHKKAA